MVFLNKSITITGASMMNVAGKDVQVAFMDARIPSDGKANTARTIQDKELFSENREEVLKDFAAFDEYVYSVMQEVCESQKLKEGEQKG